MQQQTIAYVTPLLIAGQEVVGEGRETQAIVNPATGGVIGQVTLATSADIDRAAEAATRGFEEWQRRSPVERAVVLSRAAAAVREHAERLAALLTSEQGKTRVEALAEVRGSADLIEWLGGEGKRMYGRIVPARTANVEQAVRLEPVGPVAAFAAWNYPFTLAARKVGHALAAGCSVVLKPAEECPSAIVELGRILHRAGVPENAVQILCGRPAQVSERLIKSPHIRKVTFTGSTVVGRQLAALAGQHLKRTTFELGGHAPVIVMDDANVDAFLSAAVAGKYRNAGQICISPTRFYVHQSVYHRVIEEFTERAKSIVVGDGSDPATQMGPLAHARRLSAVRDLVDDAVAQGSRLLTGGPLERPGFFWRPTVLADVPNTARLMREEPFGPIAAFVRVHDLDEALELANATDYGLAGYAFTGRIADARRIQSELKVGMVGLNTFGVTVPDMPFAGTRDSGMGIAMGTEGLLDHMHVKSVYTALP